MGLQIFSESSGFANSTAEDFESYAPPFQVSQDSIKREFLHIKVSHDLSELNRCIGDSRIDLDGSGLPPKCSLERR